MSLGELLPAAFKADPIALSVAVVGTFFVVAAIPFKRGGVSAGFIIRVFSVLATLATIPKIVLWAGASMMNLPNPQELGGTDAVLAGGGLLAIVWIAVQDLVASFGGDAKAPSLAARWWSGSALSKWLSEQFPGRTQPVEETNEAAAAREELKPK